MDSYLHPILDEVSKIGTSTWLPIIVPLFVTLVCIFLYRQLFGGCMDVAMDCTEIGFEERSNMSGNNVKKAAVNEARRRKKLGHLLPPAYPNGWFSAIQSDSLKRGESVDIQILGVDLVAWRGKESGAAYVADAFCPHLGAHLGVGSQVKGECIECPFHSWCFDGEKGGKLVHIPYAKTEEGVGLKMWTVLERNGFVFVWFHNDGEDPTWWPDEIEGIADGSLTLRGRMELQASCMLQDFTENGADFTHLNELHGDFSMWTGDPKNYRFFRDYVRHHHEGDWNVESDHMARLKGTQWIDLMGKARIMETGLDSLYVGPGIVHVVMTTPFAKFTLVQTVTPKQKGLQHFAARLYTSPWVIRPAIKSFVDAFVNQIIRDIRIFNRKTYMKQPHLVYADRKINAFRRWHNQFYSKVNSKNEKNDGKELEF